MNFYPNCNIAVKNYNDVDLKVQRWMEHRGLIISLTKTPLRLLAGTKIGNIESIQHYTCQVKVNLANLGCCLLATNNFNGQTVILKRIVNSSRKIHTSIFNFEKLLEIKSIYVEKFINKIIISNGSLWYIFQYNESMTLESFTMGIHRRVLGYDVEFESEFVHLLYSSNSVLDQSKERFPKFINIIGYISVQLLQGISHLHEKGIILKNLNPSNIIITRTGVLKITVIGATKQFRCSQYDSRSVTDNGNASNFALHKDPSKRMNESYFYMEPHVRVLIENDKWCDVNFLQKHNFEYHVDYFSVSMILFELTFGFTYGDMDLYKKYSFYEHFLNFKLIFFFSGFYKDNLIPFSYPSLIHKEFYNMQIKNLKQYLMNNENGFVDFIMEGLDVDISRWKKYIDTTICGQHFNYSKLQNNIGFFKNFNFDNFEFNMPKYFVNFLQTSSYTIESKFDKSKNDKSLIFKDTKDYPEMISNYKSFYIPEIKIKKISKFKTIADYSFSQFQIDDDTKNDKIGSKRNIFENFNSVLSKTSPKKKQKMYTSVFLHKLFDNLKNGNKEKNVQAQYMQDNSEFVLPICKLQENSNINNDLNRKERITVNNIIGKKCSLHNQRYFIHQNEICNKTKANVLKANYLLNIFPHLNDKAQKTRNVLDDHLKSINNGNLCSKVVIDEQPSTEYLNEVNTLNLSQQISDLERKSLIKNVTSCGSSTLVTKQLSDQHIISYIRSLSFGIPRRSVVEKHKHSKTLPIGNASGANKISKYNNCNCMHQNTQSRKRVLDTRMQNILTKTPWKFECPRSVKKNCENYLEYFQNAPYNSFSKLFSSRKKKLRPKNYSLTCVMSMVSKDVQTPANISGIENDMVAISDKGLISEGVNIYNIRRGRNIENEVVGETFEGIVDTIKEGEMLNLKVKIEIQFNSHLNENICSRVQKIIGCCTISYILTYINIVEENLKKTAKRCEKFRGVINENFVLIKTIKQKNNISNKIATYKFPLLTNIFHFDTDSLKSIDYENACLLFKSIDTYYLLRPSVNSENLEIIDDQYFS